jgi:acetylcholinesterase
VWSPTGSNSTSKLPVWVFIQGGGEAQPAIRHSRLKPVQGLANKDNIGYTSNSNANWNGSEVVEASGKNIVMVNFNYRVGMWGFLAGQEVVEKGDLNAGLLDQRQLLKWVQKHISKVCHASLTTSNPIVSSITNLTTF